LIRYYQEVADASPLPVLLYNAPGFTGITLSPKVVAELAGHPNIAGMKDTSSGNKDAYLNSARGKEFVILAGSANDFFPSLILGAMGGVLSLANAFPEICCELYQLTRQSQIEPARALHQKIVQANQAVSGSFGVAGVKAAMDLAGYFGGEPRRPLLPLTKEQVENLQKTLQTIGVLS
jgi:4-hydroxy-2-oxoglutarate aldolase